MQRRGVGDDDSKKNSIGWETPVAEGRSMTIEQGKLTKGSAPFHREGTTPAKEKKAAS